MKIKYTFADGAKTELEVSEEIGAVIIDSRKAEHALNEKERYHCYSYDAIEYEGEEYGSDSTPETDLLLHMENEKLYNALSLLTETQRRRLLLFSDGLSLREIARREGVDHKAIKKSIEGARKKVLKNL